MGHVTRVESAHDVESASAIEAIEAELDSTEELIDRYFIGESPSTRLDDIKHGVELLYRRATSLYRRELSFKSRARLLLSIYRMVNDLPLVAMPTQRYTRCLTEIERLVTQWEATTAALSANSADSNTSACSASSALSGFSANSADSGRSVCSDALADNETAAYIHRNLANYFQGCDPAQESTNPWYRLLNRK